MIVTIGVLAARPDDYLILAVTRQDRLQRPLRRYAPSKEMSLSFSSVAVQLPTTGVASSFQN